MNLYKIVSAAAIALTCSFAAMSPASAAPITFNPIETPSSHLVQEVGGKVTIGFYQRHGFFYYNGYRGYRHYRHGYKPYRGYYFPRNAFTARIYIGPKYIRPRYVRPRYARPHYSRSSVFYANQRHVRWCNAKYKSYRAYDNSFQPYHGPRKRCRSPYKR